MREIMHVLLGQLLKENDEFYVTNPIHGGKETCHKCNGFIKHIDLRAYSNKDRYPPDIYFHKECFNPYEHYYGLDRPID